MIYGYARVSSKDQNLDRQLEEFKKWEKENNQTIDLIYSDKESGKNFERKSYQKLKSDLKEKDLLIIKSIDRLGRNYEMIIEEWHDITKKIKADILVLDMPLLDTRDRKENLTGKFISDIVLQLLSYVAETERANIKSRQAEGIKIAQAKGVKFGRPSILDERLDFDEYYFKQDLKTMNWIRFCDKYGISRAIYFKYRKKFYPELVKSFKINKKRVLK